MSQPQTVESVLRPISAQEPARRAPAREAPACKQYPRTSLAPARTKPNAFTSVLSKTSHRDVFDGQPVRHPGTGPSGFSAPNGCPPFVTKRPVVPRPGCRPRCRALGFQLSFFLSKRKLDKEKCALRKSVSPVATGDRGALPPRLPCKPLKRLDRNFTGLRPC